MNNPSTVEQLREMRFSGMANEFDAQLKDPATYAQIPFEDRFGLLGNAEWNVGRLISWLGVSGMLIWISLLQPWRGLSTMRTGNWTRLS